MSRAFQRDAVRIAQTSGLMQRQAAFDSGIGHSALGRWDTVFSAEAKVPAQDAEPLRNNEHLRKKNSIEPDKKTVRGAVFPAECLPLADLILANRLGQRSF